jgi:hypothetical protein
MDGLFALVFVFALYFLPTLVARSAQHRQSTAIFLLNLLTGWTFFGWVIALVWAASKPAQPTVYHFEQE